MQPLQMKGKNTFDSNITTFKTVIDIFKDFLKRFLIRVNVE